MTFRRHFIGMTVSKPPILTGGAFALTKPSEEYQAQFYRQTLAMAERVPTLRGMSPWILKDFRTPPRQNPDFQIGWNRKGLISETGQHKLAFWVLADYYLVKSETKAR